MLGPTRKPICTLYFYPCGKKTRLHNTKNNTNLSYEYPQFQLKFEVMYCELKHVWFVHGRMSHSTVKSGVSEGRMNIRVSDITV